MLTVLVASALAFHAPITSNLQASRSAVAMKSTSAGHTGFWDRPDFIESQKKAASANPVRQPTIGEGQATGDTFNPNAFWKRADWQAKSAQAAADKKGKWMEGASGWLGSGVPEDGVTTYRSGQGQSGWKE